MHPNLTKITIKIHQKLIKTLILNCTKSLIVVVTFRNIFLKTHLKQISFSSNAIHCFLRFLWKDILCTKCGSIYWWVLPLQRLLGITGWIMWRKDRFMKVTRSWMERPFLSLVSIWHCSITQLAVVFNVEIFRWKLRDGKIVGDGSCQERSSCCHRIEEFGEIKQS